MTLTQNKPIQLKKINANILSHRLLLRMTSNKKFSLIRIYTNTGRSSEEQISSKRLYQVDYASRDRLKRLGILESTIE